MYESNLKNAIVIGSSSGIGLELSEYLLDEGFTVFGGSCDGTPIEHGKFIDLTVDAKDEMSVERFFEEIRQLTEEINLFVINIDRPNLDPITETSSSEFKESFFNNTLSTFHFFKHLPHFLMPFETKVILFTNKVNPFASDGRSIYNATSLAIEGLVSACEAEWKEQGIIFTTIKKEFEGRSIEFTEKSRDEYLINLFSLVLNATETQIRDLSISSEC
tara:strand:+ start:142 stop:795 length:654 start_codon:yes stop_codon:yes gene_type:complete